MDDELTPREHSEMRDLVLSGTQRIRPAGSHRAQFVAAGAALVLIGAVTGGILTAAIGQGGRPDPAASGDGRQTGSIPDAEDPPPTTPIDVEPDVWIGSLPAGATPLVPYAHDGVLYLPGAEISTPFDVGAIEVAGATIMVGGDAEQGVPTTWWLVKGDRLEQIPATDEFSPRLSADGRIAFWQTRESRDTTTFVMWDAEANRELATHTVDGWFTMGNRLQLIGVDADGIAYWVDQSSDNPIMRWDVRADTVEATDIPFDWSKAFDQQAEPLPDLWMGFEDAYTSPDGTRQVFTERAPSDSPQDCCAAQLRVRPAGPLASIESGDITGLQLPDGVPSMRLWDAFSDRGTWGVWWETNETVLLDAEVGRTSYLVRCWASGGACELVFELGPNSSSGILYMPDWEQDWVFARSTVTQ